MLLILILCELSLGAAQNQECGINSFSKCLILNEACTQCSADTYAARHTICMMCPEGSTTNGAMGADSIDDCVCTEAGTVIMAGACTKCPVDTYAETDDTVCTICPEGSTINGSKGSDSIDDCVCTEAGTVMVNRVCAKCSVDTYAATGDRTCIMCPEGSTTNGAMGSDSIDDCVCTEAGTVMVNGVCTKCSVDTYAATGDRTCIMCPEGSTTNGTTGLDSIDDCVCTEAGAVIMDGTCTKCPVDTYAATGDTTCTTCPEGSTTNGAMGSDSVDDCVATRLENGVEIDFASTSYRYKRILFPVEYTRVQLRGYCKGLGDGWDVAFIYTDNLEFISKADRLINDTRTYWIAGSFYISTYRGVVRVSDYLAFHVDLSRLQDYDGTADYANAAVSKSRPGQGSSPNYFNITPYDCEGKLGGILCAKYERTELEFASPKSLYQRVIGNARHNYSYWMPKCGELGSGWAPAVMESEIEYDFVMEADKGISHERSYWIGGSTNNSTFLEVEYSDYIPDDTGTVGIVISKYFQFRGSNRGSLSPGKFALRPTPHEVERWGILCEKGKSVR